MAAEDKDTPKLSFAEAEALAEKLTANLQPPTAEQWTGFVRSSALASPYYDPGDAKNVRLRAWWQGLAVLKLVEAQPGLRDLGLIDPLRPSGQTVSSCTFLGPTRLPR